MISKESFIPMVANNRVPAVSIIIPVYNAENYLITCLDSIKNQTFNNFEVLLINDGSTDSSGLLCDNYAEKDGRFKVFHKENAGVSAARQTGLLMLRGEYVIHIDSDDYIEPNMLECLYNEAICNKADVVICDYLWDKGSKSTLVSQKPTALDSQSILNDLFKHLHGSVCNKLISVNVIRKYNVCFPKDINLYEDLIFNIDLFKNPVKTIYINNAFYHYIQFQNTNSLTRNYSKEKLEIDINLRDYIFEITKGYVDEQLVITSLNSMILQRAFFSGYFTPKEFRARFYHMRHSVFNSHRFNLIVKLAVYLSCIGLYGPVFRIVQLMRNN